MEGFLPYTELLMNDDNYVGLSEDVEATASEPHQSPIMEKTPSSKINQKQKGKNFTQNEDRLLVSAWLNVSTDPRQGTNQTKDTFWTRVHRFYLEHRENFAERNRNSLLHRWGAIQEAVSKFCRYLRNIEDANQSGQNIHDRVEKAEQMFMALDKLKRKFQFRHCWLQLRNQPKWHERLAHLAALKNSNKKQKVNKDSSPETSHAVNGDITTQEKHDDQVLDDSIPSAIDAPTRPIGKKKAKDVLRRGGSDQCIEALDYLWAKKKEADEEKEIKKDERYAKTHALDAERLLLDKKRLANDDKKLLLEEQKLANEQMMLANEQQRLANEAKDLELKTLVEEERILSLGLSGMNQLRKEYYIAKQAAIMACLC